MFARPNYYVWHEIVIRINALSGREEERERKEPFPMHSHRAVHSFTESRVDCDCSMYKLSSTSAKMSSNWFCLIAESPAMWTTSYDILSKDSEGLYHCLFRTLLLFLRTKENKLRKDDTRNCIVYFVVNSKRLLRWFRTLTNDSDVSAIKIESNASLSQSFRIIPMLFALEINLRHKIDFQRNRIAFGATICPFNSVDGQQLSPLHVGHARHVWNLLRRYMYRCGTMRL